MDTMTDDDILAAATALLAEVGDAVMAAMPAMPAKRLCRKGEFFGECDRDEGGHCLPGGGIGDKRASGPPGPDARHDNAKVKEDYNAAMDAWMSRENARQARDDIAYNAGDDVISDDGRPAKPDVSTADFATATVDAWAAVFGSEGKLQSEMAAAGASEKELARIAKTGEKGREALAKVGERAAAKQEKAAEAQAAFEAHTAAEPEPPEEITKTRPPSPATAYVEGDEASEKEWDAANAAQEAWDAAYEKHDEDISAWQEENETLSDATDAAQVDADELWSKLDDAFDSWRDRVGKQVEDIQIAIRERIEKEGDADPEPDEPEEEAEEAEDNADESVEPEQRKTASRIAVVRKESFFSECERDDEGHCPLGRQAGEGPKEKPAAKEKPAKDKPKKDQSEDVIPVEDRDINDAEINEGRRTQRTQWRDHYGNVNNIHIVEATADDPAQS